MDDENEPKNEEDAQKTGSDEGPGKEYEIYLKNEELVDKLKLLHYEKSFLKMGIAYKPIQRHYFVKSTNVGEQFFLFTSLAAWLIRKCGDENYVMPQEFDDPNSTISNIVAAAKNKISKIRADNIQRATILEKKIDDLAANITPLPNRDTVRRQQKTVGPRRLPTTKARARGPPTNSSAEPAAKRPPMTPEQFQEQISIDFATNKLKNGAGENAIHVLNSLADSALINVGFEWKKMVAPKVEDEDVNVDEDDENMDNDQNEIEEEDDNMNMMDDDDDDENVIEIDLKAQGLSGATTAAEDNIPLQGVLQSTTDSVAWRHELERVAPMLKITIRQDAKDWRLHLEQMNNMHRVVEQKVSQIEPYLENMSKDIAKSLERIATREKTLNSQLSSQMSKFRSAQDRRAELREKYKTASVGVSSRTETLERISEDIEQLKQQIEEQGAKSNDGAPLVKIKQAVTKIEEELEKMNVQIGVLEQSILNTYLRDRYTFSTDLLNIF